MRIQTLAHSALRDGAASPPEYGQTGGQRWKRVVSGPAAAVSAELLRSASVVLLVLAVAVSSLTYGWVIDHDQSANFFPEFSGRVVYLSDLFLFAGLGVWALSRILSGRWRTTLGPAFVWVPLAGLTGMSVASAIWAADQDLTMWLSARRLLLFGLYVVIVNEGGRARRVALPVLLFIGALQSVTALAQVYGHAAVGLGHLGELTPGAFNYDLIGRPRGYGLGFNPNPMGVFMAVTAVISSGALWRGRNGRFVSTLLVFVLVISVAGVLISGSRSAILGFVLGAVLITAGSARIEMIRSTRFRPMMRHLVPIIVIVGGILVLFAARSEGLVENGLTRFTPDRLMFGIETRVQDIQLSGPVISDNLLFGVGSGNYPNELKSIIAPDELAPKVTPLHNVALLMLAELGIVGLALWLALVIGPFIWIAARWAQMRRGDAGIVIWSAPLVIVIVESLVDFTPWATQDGRVLFIAVMALWASAIPRRAANRRER